MMTHMDLFSGIGGFALAVEEVWPGSEHIFCEIDTYCRALLKKRFEGSIIYGDIRELTADTHRNRLQEQRTELKASGDRQLFEAVADTQGGQPWKQEARDWGQDFSRGSEEGIVADSDTTRQSDRVKERGRTETSQRERERSVGRCDLLTGGFPCQPFSQAGKRRGTEDNRYLWPEMLRVIKDFSPQWVIAENVRGLINISNGVVFEQVCLDLETAGYEVQAFIIPAVAVNAPHKRDRVWVVAHNTTSDGRRTSETFAAEKGYAQRPIEDRELARGFERPYSNTPDTERSSEPRFDDRQGEKQFWGSGAGENWLEVATELCGVDDGLPAELYGPKFSKSRHRIERLKALGNAIVPQVAVEIMQAIRLTQ